MEFPVLPAFAVGGAVVLWLGGRLLRWLLGAAGRVEAVLDDSSVADAGSRREEERV